jgi:outer membrane protein
VPPALRGGWAAAQGQVWRQNYPTFQVGLTLELPLRNRAADAQLAQNEFAAQRLTLQRAQFEQAIVTQVRNAFAALDSARARIKAAQLGEQAAQERLESETRLYANGESTSYFVLTRQNEFAEARRRIALAQSDWQLATARLAQATGLSLSRYQVSVQ